MYLWLGDEHAPLQFYLMYDMNVYFNKMYDMNVSFHEVLVHVHVLNMFMFVDLHLLSWKLNFCAEVLSFIRSIK